MRKVCIVGFAPETRDRANDMPDDVELWGMNINHKFMKRWDRWFQLHPPTWHGRPFYGRTLEHMKFLATCGVPVYMQYPNREFPTAVRYPLEDVYGCIGRPYLTSTVANAIALAIYERVDEINVYGVNLASNDEYINQRPCVEWLIGLAEGRGIKVVVPGDSPVLKGAHYPPLDDTNPIEVAQQRVSTQRQVYNKYWAMIHHALGGLSAINTLLADGISPEDLKLKYQLWAQDVAGHLNSIKGQIEEAKFWLRQAGGFDRDAAVMPHPNIPKGYFPDEVVKKLEDSIVKG